MTASPETAADNPMHALYRLIHEDSQDTLLAVQELEGFFLPPNEESDEITLRGVPEASGELTGDFEDVGIDVIDIGGNRIGSYYIGRVRLSDAKQSVLGAGLTDRKAFFYGSSCPYPFAGKFWRQWAGGKPTRTGEWRCHPDEAHESWLHVVQQAWFASGHNACRCGTDRAVVIDGLEMPRESSFFCALGEAVNGPGGYFGSNPAALDDCLWSSRDSSSPLHLTWRNFETSQRQLGSDFTAWAVNIMREYGVEVTPT